jgi:hypothetical protein
MIPDRHRQLVRDGHLRDIHEKMVRQGITLDELQEYSEKRYHNRSDRMVEIRNQRQHSKRVKENLEKARLAKAAKKEVK